MKTVIELGKVDFNETGKKSNLVTVEININEKECIHFETLEKGTFKTFSMSGNVWNNRKSDILTGGQMCKDLVKYFPSNIKIKRLVEIWKKYHLNDLKSGTKKQLEFTNGLDYTKALDKLFTIDSKTLAFIPDNEYMYQYHKQECNRWSDEIRVLNTWFNAQVDKEDSLPYYNKTLSEFTDNYNKSASVINDSLIFDNGYQYGTGWLCEPLPEEFEKEVLQLIEDLKPIPEAPKPTNEEKERRKEEKREAKKQAKILAKIEAEKNQKPVKEITFTIEWKKSATWGNNPNLEAVVVFKDGSSERSRTYKASGCGYDKESTVIAECFNEYLKYKLYNESFINDDNKPYGITCRKDWKYYNGGIGTSCYYKIGAYIGGKFEHITGGKTFDVYKYSEL